MAARSTPTSWGGRRRSFPTATREAILRQAQGQCQAHLPTTPPTRCPCPAAEADHVVSWARAQHLGWPPELYDSADNGQALCVDHHREKTAGEIAAGRQAYQARRPRRQRPATTHPGLK